MVTLILLPYKAESQQFLDVSGQVAIEHSAVDDLLRVVGGVVVFDYNNDHLPDIFLPSGNTNHKLYKNLGGFRFEDVSDFCGLNEVLSESSGANAADLNNDGWEDLFITTREGYSHVVLVNNQDGTFSDMTQAWGFDQQDFWGSSISFADFNQDGTLDVYVGNYADYDKKDDKWYLQGPFPNQLFLSMGDGTWREAATDLGVEGSGYTLVTLVMDFDLDGDMDIYVGNDFGSVNNNQGNVYYENTDGLGSFVDRSQEMGLDIHMFAMGIGPGDYDEDGDIDLYLSDLGGNKLLEYQDGVYVDVSNTIIEEADYVSWNGSFLDGNNNGSLDLFVVNGKVYGDEEEPFQYYERVGDQFFETRFESFNDPFFGRGMGISDIDLDGDLDLVIHSVTENEFNGSAHLRVLKNTVDARSDRGFLQLKLEGIESNRNGYGALLKLNLDNGRTLLRTLENGGGYMSGKPGLVHFGLDDNKISSLEITWPDGTITNHQELGKNSRMLIRQDGSMEILWRKELVTSVGAPQATTITAYPTIFNSEVYINGLEDQKITYLGLTDLSGKSWTIPFNTITTNGILNVASLNLSPGMYLLNLITTKKAQTFKLWKTAP